MNEPRRYRYVICDVFTATRFGGNPLAVLTDARGLSSTEMQQIAREFNFSESTFVLPGTDSADHDVRIFTPTKEIPFAGHPNIGTAFVLAADGAFGDIETTHDVVFREGAGPVPIRIEVGADDRIWCELRAPSELQLGPELPVDTIAEAASLAADDIATERHRPRGSLGRIAVRLRRTRKS